MSSANNPIVLDDSSIDSTSKDEEDGMNRRPGSEETAVEPSGSKSKDISDGAEDDDDVDSSDDDSSDDDLVEFNDDGMLEADLTVTDPDSLPAA